MAKKRILVVDDDPELVEVVSIRLKSNGYKVIPAYDGPEALKKAVKKKPDLIILDIMLPTLDGYKVCKQLKKDKRTEHIPVIFLTAKTQFVDELKGLNAGGVYYITKPYEPKDLLEKVKVALEEGDG